MGTALGGSGSTPGVGFAQCQAALTRWHPMRDNTCVYFSNIMIKNLRKDWRGDLETNKLFQEFQSKVQTFNLMPIEP